MSDGEKWAFVLQAVVSGRCGGEAGDRSFIFRKIDLKSFQDTLDKRLEVETR